MARKSFPYLSVDLDNETVQKNQKVVKTGPSIGSIRNHPTRPGIKQRYTSKGWSIIRGDDSEKSTKSKKRTRYSGGSKKTETTPEPTKVNTTDKRIKKKVQTSRGSRWRVVNNPNYKAPTPKPSKKKRDDTGPGGYYRIPGLLQPDEVDWTPSGGEVARSKAGPGYVSTKDKKSTNTNKVKISTNQKQQQGTKSPEKKKDEPKKSDIFTRHYKTGKRLGVMIKRKRDAYDAEAHAAGGKSYEERVAEYEKSSGHGKPHLRETLYNASQRKGSRSYKKLQAKLKAAQASKKGIKESNNEEKRKRLQKLFNPEIV